MTIASRYFDQSKFFQIKNTFFSASLINLFKNLIKPYLKKEAPTEDVRPPKFAQAVGFGFALVAAIGTFAGVDALFTVAVGFALAAAFLNAAFNYCLGCEMYLLITRFTSK